jgi:hypothetical protein
MLAVVAEKNRTGQYGFRYFLLDNAIRKAILRFIRRYYYYCRFDLNTFRVPFGSTLARPMMMKRLGREKKNGNKLFVRATSAFVSVIAVVYIIIIKVIIIIYV